MIGKNLSSKSVGAVKDIDFVTEKETIGCGLWLGAAERRPPERWQVALAALGAVASIVSLVLAQLSPLWRLVEQTLAH